MRNVLALILLFALGLIGCTKPEQTVNAPTTTPSPTATPAATPAGTATPTGELKEPRERHLANIRQLTFGGENAEAYWSGDGKKLIFQSTHGESKCDQIYTMNADGSEMKLVSTGKGRTTCSYYYPDGKRILFASTHAGNPDCPPPPDMSQGYVWQINKDYDIYTANPDGSDLKVLTASPGYDAEATISPDGKKIVFTSTRDGDLELYSMNADGTNIKRLTNSPGYDGGAFFSPDGKKICYRAAHPDNEKDLKDYQDLLAKGLVRPTKMELYVMNVDGSASHQLTVTGKANFCPYFLPNGHQLIFASNFADPKNRDFDLFLINADDGTNMEQVTFTPEFDGFPMFSPDGKKIVWASNRNAAKRGDTNIFVADWVE